MIAAVALDLGTTAIKAGLLSRAGALGDVVSRPAPAIVADGGRYESDALAYVAVAEAVLADCLRQTTARPALGLCSQRSSFLLWDKAGGQPVTPLISWQDDRGAASCAALRASEQRVRAIAGLPLTPYYLAPKLRQLLQEHPAWREKLLRGEWLLGTLDVFLVWRWSGGVCHQTDASMAARSLLLDIHRGQWSAELCGLFDIPQQILPRITPSVGIGLPLQNGLVLQACLADQSAALAATIADGQAEALVNLGTGGFVVRYLPRGRGVPAGYLQTLVWQDAAQQMHFAAEGTLNSIAAALADYPVAACRAEELACDDTFCLAEPSGLGAPYFRGDLGLVFSAPVADLSAERIGVLLLEGIIFRVARIAEDFAHEYGLERLWLSGGLAHLPCLQQGIAQCLSLPLHLLAQTDASLLGAARLAAGSGHAAPAAVPVRIEAGQPLPRLVEKYARWKVWLDRLLNDQPENGLYRI